MMSGLIVEIAYAEGGTCPDGYYPIGGQGTSGCAPMPYNNPTAPTPPPPVRWADRYGSIVFGVDSKGDGILGTSKDKTTSRDANDAAIQNCTSQGGHACKVALTYHNQCVATASGVTASRSASAPTLEKAIQVATEDCNAVSRECKVYYTACSMPVRIQ